MFIEVWYFDQEVRQKLLDFHLDVNLKTECRRLAQLQNLFKSSQNSLVKRNVMFLYELIDFLWNLMISLKKIMVKMASLLNKVEFLTNKSPFFIKYVLLSIPTLYKKIFYLRSKYYFLRVNQAHIGPVLIGLELPAVGLSSCQILPWNQRLRILE